MYFGRGLHDPASSAEAQGRLKDFAGATAISSNAYFGRPEDDDDESGPNGYGGGGGGGGGGSGGAGASYLGELGENETIQGLERGVRDMAGRVMANPDVQAVGEQLRMGVLKVSQATGCQTVSA